jgi:hypothetical protein
MHRREKTERSFQPLLLLPSPLFVFFPNFLLPISFSQMLLSGANLLNTIILNTFHTQVPFKTSSRKGSWIDKRREREIA